MLRLIKSIHTEQAAYIATHWLTLIHAQVQTLVVIAAYNNIVRANRAHPEHPMIYTMEKQALGLKIELDYAQLPLTRVQFGYLSLNIQAPRANDPIDDRRA